MKYNSISSLQDLDNEVLRDSLSPWRADSLCPHRAMSPMRERRFRARMIALAWSMELRIEYSMMIYFWHGFRPARDSGCSGISSTRALGTADAPSSDIRWVAAAL